MFINNLSWDQVKTFANDRNICVHWIDAGDIYIISAIDNGYTLNHIMVKTIPPSADQTDFETNYKAVGNKKIVNRSSVGDINYNTAGITSSKLKVEANISSIAPTVAPSYSNNIKSLPQLSIVPISSSSVYSTIYSYTGAGYFVGFNLEFNNTNIIIKLVVDGNTVLDGVDIATYNALAVTANATSRYQAGQGVITSSSVFDFSFKYPIVYNTSVVISARLTSGAVSKNFQQGIVYIQKDS